jgi:hypothetical protein
MANQPCPGILQVDMRFLRDGQQVQNTFHFDNGTLAAWTLDAITTVLDLVANDLWTDMQPLLSAACSLYQVIATDLTDLNGLKISRAITPAEPGGHAGGPSPSNVSMAVKLAPQTRGRGTAGRIFWPDIPETVVTANTIDSTYAGLVVDALENLRLGALNLPGTITLCVLSRYLNTVKRPEGIGREVLSCLVTDALVDSMKNRLPGHKRRKRNT